MKYRNPKTGEFVTTKEIEQYVLDHMCPHPCESCPMNGMKCAGLMRSDPDKVASLIGLVPEIMLCAVLGVKVGDKFRIRGYKDNVLFEILPNGQYKTTPENVAGSSYAIIDAMWGTMWAFDDNIDNWWLEEDGGLQKMADCGFRIFEQEDFGYIFGIDGAGYSFFDEHWISCSCFNVSGPMLQERAAPGAASTGSSAFTVTLS